MKYVLDLTYCTHHCCPFVIGETSASLPVIVYVHGESYERNSGNLYDGRVLTSYGQDVVVTINFHLGVLDEFGCEALRVCHWL